MNTIVKSKKHNFKSPNSLENHSLFGLLFLQGCSWFVIIAHCLSWFLQGFGALIMETTAENNEFLKSCSC